MNSIVYVGMDVHKEQYTICCYSYETGCLGYSLYHQLKDHAVDCSAKVSPKIGCVKHPLL